MEDKTTGHSNLTKRPHRRRTWMVRWYSLGRVSMHPNYTTCFLGPTQVQIPNGILIGFVQPFLHGSRQRVGILYHRPPLSPWRLPLSMEGSGHPPTTCCLGPTRVLNLETASRSFQPFLQNSLLWQTDRQAEISRYSFCNSWPHLST